jgi:hypothetical protein
MTMTMVEEIDEPLTLLDLAEYYDPRIREARDELEAAEQEEAARKRAVEFAIERLSVGEITKNQAHVERVRYAKSQENTEVAKARIRVLERQREADRRDIESAERARARADQARAAEEGRQLETQISTWLTTVLGEWDAIQATAGAIRARTDWHTPEAARSNEPWRFPWVDPVRAPAGGTFDNALRQLAETYRRVVDR